MRITMEVEVEYEANGEQPGRLASRLIASLGSAIDEGRLTGDGPAELSSARARVKAAPGVAVEKRWGPGGGGPGR